MTADDRFLDATGLLCPEPVMLLHRQLREMVDGESIKITATDPSTMRDFKKLCVFLNHELVEQWQEDNAYHFIIVKRGKRSAPKS